MSTIHAFTTPARGHLYPLAPILAELARRGHRVRVWSLAGELEPLRAMGIEAEPMDPRIEELQVDDWKAKGDMEATVRGFRCFLDRAPHEIAEIGRAVAAGRPDLLITDINAYGAAVAAEASGIPWACFSPYFSWAPSNEVPVFGPGMKPMRGPVGRLRNAAMWRLVGFDLNRRFLGELNGLRREAEVPELGSITELWDRPHRLLYMTVRELEYPRRSWPANFRFVGPVAWDPPADSPDWLDAIDGPLVLLTASTEYQADEELIRTGLNALAEEEVFVVATTAGNDPAQFDVPANARVERFLPHAPILERAEAVICHGGMGITQKALAAGVPVCTVGWGRDQLESGRRVEAAGAGVLLPRKKLSADRLREALASARDSRTGAARIARAMAAAPGARGAADELEALAGIERDRSAREPLRADV